MHRTGVDDRPLGHPHIHLGDQRERLVGRRVKVRREPFPFGDPLAVVTENVELPGERRDGRLCAHVDGCQRIGPLGSTVLERQLSRLLEENVDDDSLRGREDHRVDELLALVAAAIAADELDSRARQGDVEHTRVRSVGQVEANDLAELSRQRQVGLTADEQDIAEPPHCRVRRLGPAERSDLSVFDQHVVERQ